MLLTTGLMIASTVAAVALASCSSDEAAEFGRVFPDDSGDAVVEEVPVSDPRELLLQGNVVVGVRDATLVDKFTMFDHDHFVWCATTTEVGADLWEFGVRPGEEIRFYELAVPGAPSATADAATAASELALVLSYDPLAEAQAAEAGTPLDVQIVLTLPGLRSASTDQVMTAAEALLADWRARTANTGHATRYETDVAFLGAAVEDINILWNEGFEGQSLGLAALAMDLLEPEPDNGP